MTIREFLTARLDEAEQHARKDLQLLAPAMTGPDLVVRMVRMARRRDEHALRDVESKRRILAAYVDDDRVRFGAFESCSDSCPATVLDEVLKLLALPYDQHPDYQSGWAP